MLWFVNKIIFKKNIYEEWEVKGKLTYLKIIHIMLLSLWEFLFKKCHF